MQTKSFIAILLCAVILVTSVYTAYQLGTTNGYNKAIKDGKITLGAFSWRLDPGMAYQSGYLAGLHAQNTTIPP
jgi:hypothetical protein